jgi:hypothetical protein
MSKKAIARASRLKSTTSAGKIAKKRKKRWKIARRRVKIETSAESVVF